MHILAIADIHSAMAFLLYRKFLFLESKMLRREATRVELKVHLRAHTGAQRVTK